MSVVDNPMEINRELDEISAKSMTNKTISVMGWNIFLIMGPISVVIYISMKKISKN